MIIKNKKIWAHSSVNLNEDTKIYSLLLSPINNAYEHYLDGEESRLFLSSFHLVPAQNVKVPSMKVR